MIVTLTNTTATQYKTIDLPGIDDFDSLKIWLRVCCRGLKQPLTLERAALLLQGQETKQLGQAQITVRKFELSAQAGPAWTRARTHTPKAPVNEVLDWRTRPKPFNRDGSCSGGGVPRPPMKLKAPWY